MTNTIILGRPLIATIPNVDKSQSKTSTIAICRRGDGSTPMAHRITEKISMSQREIVLPLNVKIGTLGIERPGI
jgi:hypothetical protein